MFGDRRANMQAQQTEGRELLAILKERLARGEITPDEYERIRAIVAEAPAQAGTPLRPRQMAGG